MDKKPFDKKHLLTSQQRPPGSVVQIVSALLINVIVKLYLMRKRALKKFYEHLESECLHRAVHEQYRIVVIVQSESIAFESHFSESLR